MFRVRGGSGLGDAVYVRPVVEHLRTKNPRLPVTVCTDYPDVFRGVDCSFEKFNRNRINVLAHYTLGKNNRTTTQWDDICASSKLGKIALKSSWRVINHVLVKRIVDLAEGRPIIIVHGGRQPMARADGFGRELMPQKEAFDAVLKSLRDCLTVQVGKAEKLYTIETNIDLNGGTSVSDLMDLASVCDGWVAQCSFAVPMAEIFDKPLLAIWSRRGITHGRHEYIRSITPQKILSKATSRHIMDDWPAGQIEEVTRAFRQF